MNLIFDIGNTSSKLAVFDGRNKITVFRTRDLSCDELENKLSPFIIEKAIISSVKTVPEYITDLLLVNIPYIHMLSHKSVLPFRNEYQTAETLGADRIAAVAGACLLFPGTDVLIIDAGTAITYDFVANNSYKGGNISPGLAIRFKALNRFTDKLPLINVAENFSSPGLNTNDAISAGVVTGVIYEINEYIRTFEESHADCKVVLTGGDSRFLKDKINHQPTYLPDIVVDGLNYILEYNAQ